MKIKTLQDELINAGLYEINSYETAEEAEGFFLTPLQQKETGLAMNIYLRCLENKGEPPFLRFQNDRNFKLNYNLIKMYLDGTLDNYENKTIILDENEMQELKDWVTLNKDAICRHYYQEYSSIKVIRKLNKYERKNVKFKNIKCVFPINEHRSLCKIECHNCCCENQYETYFLNKNKQIVACFKNPTPVSIEQLNANSDELFILYDLDEKYEVVKMQSINEYEVLHSYQEMEDEDEYYAVKKDSLWGFMNLDGIEIIPPQFDKYHITSELIAVRKNRKWGVIDFNGNVVIDIKYHRIHDFWGDYALVHSDEGYFTLIDKNENVILASDKRIYNFDGETDILLCNSDTQEYEIINVNDVIETENDKKKSFRRD